jgi:hypothetical protein
LQALELLISLKVKILFSLTIWFWKQIRFLSPTLCEFRGRKASKSLFSLMFIKKLCIVFEFEQRLRKKRLRTNLLFFFAVPILH